MKFYVYPLSNNCAAVLTAAGIAPLFDARVDGIDITRLALNGKPAPDAFLEAAQRVKAEPSRVVVVEDAIAGVEAECAGRFGCVIAVDHSGQSQALREARADVVVTSLAQVKVAVEPPSGWSLVYEGFDPAREGMREALCALGNGYVATRGAAVWARADDIRPILEKVLPRQRDFEELSLGFRLLCHPSSFGGYAIVFGIVAMMLAFRLRALQERLAS